MIAVVWAASTVAACGTGRQASASHPADGAASTATSQARPPVSLTAASNGTTVRLFRGQSVSVLLGDTALPYRGLSPGQTNLVGDHFAASRVRR